MADEREEIRSRIDIVDLVSQRVALKRAGKTWKGLCPFHDDRNPSFVVDSSTGRYKCWACGEGGDVFNWVMKTQNVEFTEALHILAELAGVKLSKKGAVERSERTQRLNAMESALAFFRAEFEKSPNAKGYCERRNLDAAILDQWEIGYAPELDSALTIYLQKGGHVLAECKQLFLVDQDASGGFFDKFRGRLMFPIRDERGALVAFGGRILGDGHPKYINSGDTPIYKKSRVLYGMHLAKEAMSKTRSAVLVEGYLDVIACHRAGVNTAVASLGTALAEEHVKLLKRWCDEVVVLYDADSAGQKAAKRASEMLVAEGLKVRVALMPAGEDPDTLLRTQGEQSVRNAALGGITPIDFALLGIKSQKNPIESDFWAEAIDVLASYPMNLEVEKHIEELAALYPGVRDQLAAKSILRKQVINARRTKRAADPHRDSQPAQRTQIHQSPISVLERAVFVAFIRDRQRSKAWQAMASSEIFETDAGAKLAAAIRGAFPSKPPEGKPVEWLGQIEPANYGTVLAELEQAWTNRIGDDRIDTDAELEEALLALNKKRDARLVQELKSNVGADGSDDDSDRLREINERLRNLHRHNK